MPWNECSIVFSRCGTIPHKQGGPEIRLGVNAIGVENLLSGRSIDIFVDVSSASNPALRLPPAVAHRVRQELRRAAYRKGTVRKASGEVNKNHIAASKRISGAAACVRECARIYSRLREIT